MRMHKLYRHSVTTGKCDDCGLVDNHTNACHEAAPIRKVEALYDELEQKEFQKDADAKAIEHLSSGIDGLMNRATEAEEKLKESNRLNGELKAELEAIRELGKGVYATMMELVNEVQKKDQLNKRLKDALDRDKTGLASALAKVREEVKGRRWICEGRGPYTYDDDRYRLETGLGLDAIEKIAVDALAASGKLAQETLAEKRICAHKTVPTFDGLGVRYRCQLCNEYIPEP